MNFRSAMLIVFVLLIACERNTATPSTPEKAPAAPDELQILEDYAVTSDGVKLYYRAIGAGDDVVIAPNAMYHGEALDPLASPSRRIITFDQRGRGRSDAVETDKVSLDHLLMDFDTIRQVAGADSVAIIGWSGTGMEAFVYGLRNPGRVERLVQLAPVAARIDPYGTMMFEDRDRRTNQEARDDYRRRVEAGEYEGAPVEQCQAFQAVTLPPTFSDPASASLAPDVCGMPNERPGATDEYFAKLFESIAGYDWRDELAETSFPRLVVHGADDNIPLAGNEEWVDGHDNARIIVIEDAGHWPHYEQPEETLSAIRTFLDGDWPPEARAIP